MAQDKLIFPRRYLKNIFLIFLGWVVISNIFALIALNRFNINPDTAFVWTQDYFRPLKTWDPVPLHNGWDAYWYMDIARQGYSLEGQGNLVNIVFFPLYPMLLWFVSPFFMGNLISGGWFLSSFFLFLSLIYFFKLVSKFHPEINPYQPLFFLLTFPTAFFLNVLYAESLFLFLSLAAFYYMLEKRLVWAAVFAGLASVTRLTGIFLLLPLLWEYFLENRFGWRAFFKSSILPLLITPLFLAAYFFYYYLKFGDFFIFFKAQKQWGRDFVLSWQRFNLTTPPAVVNFTLDVFFVVFAFVVTFFVFRRLRFSYGLYMIISIISVLSSGTPTGTGRYILVLFPIYILAAGIKNVLIKYAWVYGSTLLLALYIILFVNNYWAG